MTYLANNPLLREISPETLSRDFDGIVSHLHMFRKGDILARQGDVCNRLMILLRDSVRGEMIGYSGRLIKVKDIIAPRAMASLFLLGADNCYPVEVTTNKATEIFETPKGSVLKLFQRNERFLESYISLSTNYARTLADKLFFMPFKTIRQKLVSYLLRILEQQEGDSILLGRSQQESVDYFGVSHPSPACELAHMQDGGPVRTDRKLVYILRKEDSMQLIQ